MIASMEGKLQQLATQLTEQVNMYKEIEAKYHRAEARSIDLETKYKSLDSEYCANECLRDNLRTDRAKYFAFLERLGCLLKISEISADLGLDMNIDLLVARIEQLVRSESDSLSDKQANIYNLQRKVKSLKEQLDSKELHLDLLRKKLAGLEEERGAKCALEKEVDDHVAMSKKFKVKVEKLTEQLNGLRCENESLKSCHVDVNGLRGRINEQEKEVARLLCRITELESVKEKQACKLAKYKEELESYSGEISKTRSSSDMAVTALSQELRSLKVELEKTIDREKQVRLVLLIFIFFF
jgi:chromosome segregation ATPase